MRFSVDGDCPCPQLSWKLFKHLEITLAGFLDDSQAALAVRTVSSHENRIIHCTIHSATDGQSGQNIPALYIHYDNHSVVTDREKDMILGIYCQAAWTFARRQ